MSRRKLLVTTFLALLCPAIALWVFLSPLAFVPVPWPDDSAFYLVAKDLFQWPPRWVMIPQAPFEPTYRIFNFNTMPLYPILIGLGRLIGIDGIIAIKAWPLAAWALTGTLLLLTLRRAGLALSATVLVGLAFSLDPALRWASVLVRPESLIGLAGMAIVLALTLGPERVFPKRLQPRGLFDPIALLLALAAYSHFNAIHLLFPVVLTLISAPRRLLGIALKTALYLSPWLLVVLFHIRLFVHQMTTQWTRLAVGNGWLSSFKVALRSIFQSMGSPTDWHPVLQVASACMWILILVALFFGLARPAIRLARDFFADPENKTPPTQAAPASEPASAPSDAISLLPSAAWILGSAWLWHTKPEVWFTYYLHVATWCFAGILFLKLSRSTEHPARRWALRLAAAAPVAICAAIFAFVDVTQAREMARSASWNWPTYFQFVDCVDQQLTELESSLAKTATPFTREKPFRVWGPTFPDVLVELSRRHRDWELTRTNDFHERNPLAIRHGHEVDAVVVTETINHTDRWISAPMSEHAEVQSAWLTWDAHYLNQLWIDPTWKPKNRYLCQRGRWMAFIIMKDKPEQSTQACPIAVVPGKSLGSATIGDTATDLEQKGFKFDRRSQPGEVEFAENGSFRFALIGGKLVEVWLDDLRQAPDCVTYDGKKIDRAIPVESLSSRFQGCEEPTVRMGGTTMSCRSGISFGYGTEASLQLRISADGKGVESVMKARTARNAENKATGALIPKR